MYVIVGLGNPGKEYERTRHNIGFIAIDYFAQKHGIEINKIKHKAVIGEGRINNQKIMLVKPQTYMNLSGQSVREIAEYYNIEDEEIIVVYDDIDIDTGEIRIRKSGSAGTHNGMKSIIYDLQSDQFPRVRVGISRDARMDLAKYVLSRFSDEENKVLEETVPRIADILGTILENGVDKAMNTYNKKQRKQDDQ